MTITKEERERVAKMWFADWAAEIIARDGVVPSDFSKEISIADIDRVAQALRDAAPQWREVTETEPARDGELLALWFSGRLVGVLGRRKEWGFEDAADGATVNPTHWMPLPAPPQPKPAPAPGPQPIAQPGASEAARIEALERTVTELALAVERLSGKE